MPSPRKSHRVKKPSAKVHETQEDVHPTSSSKSKGKKWQRLESSEESNSDAEDEEGDVRKKSSKPSCNAAAITDSEQVEVPATEDDEREVILNVSVRELF